MKRRRTVALSDETTVACPYCHESQLLVLDPDTVGEFVHDCDVCCHPWRVRVERDASGDVTVDVDRAQ